MINEYLVENGLSCYPLQSYDYKAGTNLPYNVITDFQLVSLVSTRTVRAVQLTVLNNSGGVCTFIINVSYVEGSNTFSDSFQIIATSDTVPGIAYRQLVTFTYAQVTTNLYRAAIVFGDGLTDFLNSNSAPNTAQFFVSSVIYDAPPRLKSVTFRNFKIDNGQPAVDTQYTHTFSTAAPALSIEEGANLVFTMDDIVTADVVVGGGTGLNALGCNTGYVNTINGSRPTNGNIQLVGDQCHAFTIDRTDANDARLRLHYVCRNSICGNGPTAAVNMYFGQLQHGLNAWTKYVKTKILGDATTTVPSRVAPELMTQVPVPLPYPVFQLTKDVEEMMNARRFEFAPNLGMALSPKYDPGGLTDSVYYNLGYNITNANGQLYKTTLIVNYGYINESTWLFDSRNAYGIGNGVKWVLRASGEMTNGVLSNPLQVYAVPGSPGENYVLKSMALAGDTSTVAFTGAFIDGAQTNYRDVIYAVRALLSCTGLTPGVSAAAGRYDCFMIKSADTLGQHKRFFNISWQRSTDPANSLNWDYRIVIEPLTNIKTLNLADEFKVMVSGPASLSVKDNTLDTLNRTGLSPLLRANGLETPYTVNVGSWTTTQSPTLAYPGMNALVFYCSHLKSEGTVVSVAVKLGTNTITLTLVC